MLTARTKKVIRRTLKFIVIAYVLICTLAYFFQEKLIFLPEKLGKNFRFKFSQPFEEIYINADDGKKLHGLLFKTDSVKGLVFYLHGNAGSLKRWGEVAKTYTSLHHDVFVLDYRGYGKSEGSISSEEQLYSDIQKAYDSLKHRYPENRIVIIGYSIGTGPAAKLASTNYPKMLILQAPYFSLPDLVGDLYPFLPTFIVKYQFNTAEYLRQYKKPVILFHGTEDELIYYGSAVKLRKLLKHTDTLITLYGQRHNGITDNSDYQRALETILR